MITLFPPSDSAAALTPFVPIAALSGDEAILTQTILAAENAAQATVIETIDELQIEGRRALEIMLSSYLTCIGILAIKLGLTADDYARTAALAHAEAAIGIDITADLQGEA